MSKTEIATSFVTGLEYISALISWEQVKNFANSSFFVAMAGAFAGAYFAQRIAERGKLREELIREIRETNAAIMLAHTICNYVIGLKRQHVKPLKEKFDKAQGLEAEHRRRVQAAEIPGDTNFYFDVYLATLPQSRLPIDALQKLIFERISVNGRPLSLVATLAETTSSLNGSIDRRNELIEQFKVIEGTGSAQVAQRYFGLPYGDGHVNREYPDTVSAISSTVDDAIFFSHLLCVDLHKHGLTLAASLRKKFRGPVPHVNESDFGVARCAGLMPSEKDYSEWLHGFASKSLPQ